MLVKLHANAATTPKTRAYIQGSALSVAELVRELGVSEGTVRRWKTRRDVSDRSSRPHALATGFSFEEEEIAVGLRTDLGLSLDDLLEVMRRCLRPDISRSALHRCLKRRGVSGKARASEPPAQTFDPTPFGYVHVDLKHLPRLERRPAYVFVAIERTTRFVHAEIIQERSGQTVAGCLRRFLQAFGYPVHTVLTDNGSEFTDRFGDARWRTRDKGTGNHPFDRVCQDHAIKHRLTKPYRPQTNGMVERFNRRLADAIRGHTPSGANGGKNRFADTAQRDTFILTFVKDYNRTRLRCLGHKAPAEVLDNLPGHNTFAGIHAAPGSPEGAPDGWKMGPGLRRGNGAI
ncbi:MAG: DDE-type integrase/transposase/recombinase [Caulobacter sp.]|nr:DDE-type integrase/transposase/recombinase [Caulobacter sp.]